MQAGNRWWRDPDKELLLQSMCLQLKTHKACFWETKINILISPITITFFKWQDWNDLEPKFDQITLCLQPDLLDSWLHKKKTSLFLSLLSAESMDTLGLTSDSRSILDQDLCDTWTYEPNSIIKYCQNKYFTEACHQLYDCAKKSYKGVCLFNNDSGSLKPSKTWAVSLLITVSVKVL